MDHAKQGDFAKGLQDIDEAIRLKPIDPTAYVYRSEIFDLKGDPEQALASLSRRSKRRQGIHRPHVRGRTCVGAKWRKRLPIWMSRFGSIRKARPR